MVLSCNRFFSPVIYFLLPFKKKIIFIKCSDDAFMIVINQRRQKSDSKVSKLVNCDLKKWSLLSKGKKSTFTEPISSFIIFPFLIHCTYLCRSGQRSIPLFTWRFWLSSSTVQEYLNCTQFCQLQVLDGFLVCRGWKVAGGLRTQHCVTSAGVENTKSLFSVIKPPL